MAFEEKIKEILDNFNLGNFLKAEGIAKSLLAKNIKHYQLYYIYGLTLVKLDKNEGAISYLQKSIHLKPDFFEAHFNLSYLFYKVQQLLLRCLD